MKPLAKWNKQTNQIRIISSGPDTEENKLRKDYQENNINQNRTKEAFSKLMKQEMKVSNYITNA